MISDPPTSEVMQVEPTALPLPPHANAISNSASPADLGTLTTRMASLEVELKLLRPATATVDIATTMIPSASSRLSNCQVRQFQRLQFNEQQLFQRQQHMELNEFLLEQEVSQQIEEMKYQVSAFMRSH